MLDKNVNDLNSVKIFRKFDLMIGYYQLEFDKDLKYIIIFLIFFGIY